MSMSKLNVCKIDGRMCIADVTTRCVNVSYVHYIAGQKFMLVDVVVYYMKCNVMTPL